jgi:proteasome beta subunit
MTDGAAPPPLLGGGPIGANPSFFDLVAGTRPELLTHVQGAGSEVPGLPHGTTVLGLKFADGVVFAGDRRATEGYSIADDRMQKVFAADDRSAIALAGAAGQAVEIVKLFQLELEHYEKITGDRLSLEGKANRLAQMIRGNFPLALQGLVVVPLFGGYDERRGQGRIFYYDATGGRWEEEDFHATGSGGRPAKSSLKKRWRPDMDAAEAVRVAVEALVDASQEDAATGGVDPSRGIYPLVLVVGTDGVRDVPDDEVRTAYDAVTQEDGGAQGASASARAVAPGGGRR